MMILTAIRSPVLDIFLGDEILVQFDESSGRGLSKHLTNGSPVLGVPIGIFIASTNQNLSSRVVTQVLFLLANQKAVYMMGSRTANHRFVDLPKTWILLSETIHTRLWIFFKGIPDELYFLTEFSWLSLKFTRVFSSSKYSFVSYTILWRQITDHDSSNYYYYYFTHEEKYLREMIVYLYSVIKFVSSSCTSF